jgi:hypothetical protein
MRRNGESAEVLGAGDPGAQTQTREQSVLNLCGVDMQARDIVARGRVMTKNPEAYLSQRR